MKCFLLAAVIELFFDCAPENAKINQFAFVGELPKRIDLRPWEEKNQDHIWVFWNLGNRVKDFDFSSVNKDRLVLFTWEPPTVQPELHDPKVHQFFGQIFTWNDDLVDNKKYFKFYYPELKQRIEKIVPFKEKKFCTLINSRLCSNHPNQLYKERENTIRFFEDKPGEFDLYGKYWEKRKYKNWRGTIPNKLEVLQGYKFCICYENTQNIKGYITEKIFDCFAAGVVPVYWGASNVTDYIPADCFIDRRKFKNNKKLYQFLKKISPEEYERYLQAANAFLKSEKAQLFTQKHFEETFLKIAN